MLLSQGHRLLILNAEVRFLAWLVAAAILSIPFSKWPGGSWESFNGLYSKSIILFVLVATLLVSFKRFHQLLWAISLFAAFNAGMGIRRYLAGDFYSHNRILGGASGIASNPNDLALVLNLTIPFIGYLYMTSRSRSGKAILAGFFALAVVGIVVTYSRGGFLTLAVLLLWSIYVKPRRQRATALIRGAVMISLAVIALLTFAPAGYVERLSSTVDTSKDKEGSAQTRLALIEGSAEWILEHPLGAGLNMHTLALQEKGLGWIAVHNVYLQYAADLGIIGVSLFVVILCKLVMSMRRIRLRASGTDRRLAALASATEVSLGGFHSGRDVLSGCLSLLFLHHCGHRGGGKRTGATASQKWKRVLSEAID